MNRMNPSRSTLQNGTTFGPSNKEEIPSTSSTHPFPPENDEFPKWSNFEVSPLKPVSFKKETPPTSKASSKGPSTRKSTPLDWGHFTEPRVKMVWKVDELRQKKFQRTGVYEGPSEDFIDFSSLRSKITKEKEKQTLEQKKRKPKPRRGMHHKLRTRKQLDFLANIEREEEDEDDGSEMSEDDWIQESWTESGVKKRVRPRFPQGHPYYDGDTDYKGYGTDEND